MAAFVEIRGVTPPVIVNLDCVTSVVTGVAVADSGVSGPAGCVIFTTDGKSYAVESQQFYNEILPYINAHLASKKTQV